MFEYSSEKARTHRGESQVAFRMKRTSRPSWTSRARVWSRVIRSYPGEPSTFS